MPVRVLTWNLWWRFGPWERRAPGIEATLAAAAADVVCLQEVWAADGRNQADDLGAALGCHVVTSAAGDDRPALGNAVLSRHPVTASEVVALPASSGAPGPRTVVWARIDAPIGPVDVFCTHLAYRFDESALRRAQLAAVVDTVAARRGSVDHAFPPILCGDLNAVPDSDEIRALTGAAPPFADGVVFTDAWAAVGRGPGHTWDDRNPHLATTSWPRRRLDYVLVGWPRPKPLGNPVRARLAGGRPIGGEWPSDHLAVVVDLDTRRAGPDERDG